MRAFVLHEPSAKKTTGILVGFPLVYQRRISYFV